MARISNFGPGLDHVTLRRDWRSRSGRPAWRWGWRSARSRQPFLIDQLAGGHLPAAEDVGIAGPVQIVADDDGRAARRSRDLDLPFDVRLADVALARSDRRRRRSARLGPRRRRAGRRRTPARTGPTGAGRTRATRPWPGRGPECRRPCGSTGSCRSDAQQGRRGHAVAGRRVFCSHFSLPVFLSRARSPGCRCPGR